MVAIGEVQTYVGSDERFGLNYVDFRGLLISE